MKVFWFSARLQKLHQKDILMSISLFIIAFIWPTIMSTQAQQNPKEYQAKINNEINFYKDCDNVHSLPDIFHYWSNKYLLPKFQNHGFSSPDDFFIKSTIKFIKDREFDHQLTVLSIGSGNGESELALAKELQDHGYENFNIVCLDINPHMLERCQKQAVKEQLDHHITTICADFNQWTTDLNFDLVIANQCLHHVLNLEHLFEVIYQSLNDGGEFLVSDMIGRNGHMRWPEAMEALSPIWSELPDRLKYNQLLQRFEADYINHDCSQSGFEGIRAQDILPLLTKQFYFDLFIPFANLVLVLVDRPFGHNYDIENSEDLAIIDRVHAIDEKAISDGQIKPTQMVAKLSKHPKKTALSAKHLTPEFCIRPVEF